MRGKNDVIDLAGGGQLLIPRKLYARWWHVRRRPAGRREFVHRLEQAMAKDIS